MNKPYWVSSLLVTGIAREGVGGGGLKERGVIEFVPQERGGLFLRGGLTEDLRYFV